MAAIRHTRAGTCRTAGAQYVQALAQSRCAHGLMCLDSPKKPRLLSGVSASSPDRGVKRSRVDARDRSLSGERQPNTILVSRRTSISPTPQPVHTIGTAPKAEITLPAPSLSSIHPPSTATPSIRLDTYKILPSNPYMSHLRKIDTHYSTLWYLEMYMQDRGLVWADFEFGDFAAIGGPAEAAIPILSEVIHKVELRKSVTARDAPPITSRDQGVWREMDLEETSIRLRNIRGLGNNDPSWPYARFVCYSILVECDPLGNGTPAFTMRLKVPCLSDRSFRLARRFGSRRILTFDLRIKGRKDKQAFFDLFKGTCFELFGRTFRAFHAPQDGESVLAIETSEMVKEPVDPRKAVVGKLRRDPAMLSFVGFMDCECGLGVV
jgi:hypothetical protein